MYEYGKDLYPLRMAMLVLNCVFGIVQEKYPDPKLGTPATCSKA